MHNDSLINVLHITIGDGNFGGVASFLYTYYSRMDHSRVHFDILYCGENSMKSKQDDPVLEGSEITTLHILKRVDNGFSEYKKLMPELKRIFSEKNYDIVHVNSGNLYLNYCVAKALKGRAKLIAHSHNAKPTVEYSGKLKRMIKSSVRKPCISYVRKKADAMFACSDQAGESLFGPDGIRSPKFRVINNAIDTRKFSFDDNVRNSLRGDEKTVVGFVGRLSDQKNPGFAIDVFAELLKKKPEAVMWMVGEGELRDKTEERIKALGLEDKIKLLGRREDVPGLMQAMDIMLFPSVFEGFGIVAVEAQCTGLPVLASDCVPQSANVAGLVTYLPLGQSPSVWADKAAEIIEGGNNRKCMADEICSAGFDIYSEAKHLEEIYAELCGRSGN